MWLALNSLVVSTLVQVMAWCRQAPSLYLSQCWPWSMPPYSVTRPQWVVLASLQVVCFVGLVGLSRKFQFHKISHFFFTVLCWAFSRNYWPPTLWTASGPPRTAGELVYQSQRSATFLFTCMWHDAVINCSVTKQLIYHSTFSSGIFIQIKVIIVKFFTFFWIFNPHCSSEIQVWHI